MDAKSLIGFGALAAGGYLLYNWYAGHTVAPSDPATPLPGSTSTTDRILGATLKQQILTTSGFTVTDVNNADHWAYYWNLINGVHGGAISADTFNTLFVAPYGGNRDKMYTLDEFLNVLSTKGLSGSANRKALGNIGLSTRPNIMLSATAYERALKF